MMIKFENLAKSYDDKILFQKVNLKITDAHRVGIIGKNGAGKTTFLKILAKEIKPQRGTISIDPPRSKIVYHSQVLEADSLLGEESEDNNKKDLEVPVVNRQSITSAFQYLISQNKTLFDLWKKINSGLEDEHITDLISEYSELGGYFFEDKIVKACKQLKLNPDQSISTLSGGQKTRLQFGKLLIEEHDILLLDEPTNHLDVEGIDWFYRYIENYKGIVIIATHDRNLLERSVNKIIEFENGTVREYSGNYSFYKSKKHGDRVSAEKKLAANEKRVEKLNDAAKSLENRVKRHERRAQEWEVNVKRALRLDKKNKAAKTKIIKGKLALYKDNDKLSRNFKLDRQSVKFKAARGNLLTKADRVNTERAKIGWNIKIDFHTPEIQSDFVLRIKNLTKSFDAKQVVKNLSLDVMKNQKVVISGPNGAGKSTILKCIAGEIKDFGGDIHISESIKLGYLDQENLSLNYNNSVLHEFKLSAGNISDTEARSFLHFFLFEGDMPLRLVKTLSEGEKLKLKLAKLLYSQNNFLLLDEPTNHLDIASQEVIEKALHDFHGSILMITHDQALIKGVGVEKVVTI